MESNGDCEQNKSAVGGAPLGRCAEAVGRHTQHEDEVVVITRSPSGSSCGWCSCGRLRPGTVAVWRHHWDSIDCEVYSLNIMFADADADKRFPRFR